MDILHDLNAAGNRVPSAKTLQLEALHHADATLAVDLELPQPMARRSQAVLLVSLATALVPRDQGHPRGRSQRT